MKNYPPYNFTVQFRFATVVVIVVLTMGLYTAILGTCVLDVGVFSPQTATCTLL